MIDPIHPALVVAAYQNGWNDGYAEGYGKASADHAAPQPVPERQPQPAEAWAPGRVTIPYTNRRGEFAMREIAPLRMFWGSTEWHPEPQWLIEAWDITKSEIRTFALSGIGHPAPAALTATGDT